MREKEYETKAIAGDALIEDTTSENEENVEGESSGRSAELLIDLGIACGTCMLLRFSENKLNS